LLGFTHFAKDGTYYAFWERPKETDKVPYSREYERGAEGRYYFHCINMVEEPVDLALAFKSCDCAKLFVALIAPEEAMRLAKPCMPTQVPRLAKTKPGSGGNS